MNLLRNVHTVGSRSSVSEEFPGLKRRQVKDNRKRRGGYTGKSKKLPVFPFVEAMRKKQSRMSRRVR